MSAPGAVACFVTPHGFGHAARAAAVLSATAVGAIAGFVFYLWGQRQELQAVESRKLAAAARIEEKEM